MKKVLLLAIVLIVGCASENDGSPTGSSVHPLVGVWEGTEITINYTSGVLTGTSMTTPLGENTQMGTVTYIFGADGVASTTSADATVTETDSGTWSATGNKLTLLSIEETTIIDYSISGNILTMFMEYDGTPDGEISFTSEMKFTKQ